MPTDPIVLIGAGGHCKVVVDALLKAGRARLDIVVLDQADERIGRSVLGIPVERYEATRVEGRSFHVCIGHNTVRKRFFEELPTGRPLTIVHPLASIADQSQIGGGCFIAAQAVVGPDARIAEGCIVNHGAVVDHDVSIGGFSHVAPGATLGGAVRVGSSVLVGAGANVMPGVIVGDNTVVGAGALVLKDLPPNIVCAGVPARRIS